MANQTNKIVKSQITGLILAGGRGARVENSDKGLLEWGGESLIKQQINWLAPQVSTLLISANRNIPVYESFDCRVLRDDSEEFLGPLQGVYKGLATCETEWLFVHPVDVPNLPIETIEMFTNKIDSLDIDEQSDSYFLKSNTREHYLSMLIAKSKLPHLFEFINENKNRVKDFHALHNSVSINLGINERCFKNFNRICDF